MLPALDLQPEPQLAPALPRSPQIRVGIAARSGASVRFRRLPIIAVILNLLRFLLLTATERKINGYTRNRHKGDTPNRNPRN
jgi:hypothetical protein